MKRYQSIGELPLGEERRVLAIGTFDGVHRGHQAIIQRAIERARSRGLQSMVLTFEPNPLAILRPELAPAVLTEPHFKAQVIEALGADALLVVPFTPAFARIRAERFVEMLGSAPLNAESIVVGTNFRFGHGGSGTSAYLQRLGRARGIVVESPGTVVSHDGKPMSSTRVRRLVSVGQVADVIPLLGRPHSVEGMVVPGDRRGRDLGFPTANVSVPSDIALPGRGVYAGRVVLATGRYPAAINLGYAPTFTADEDPLRRLEAFILDYEGGDLYGERIRVEFLERLRNERRFPTPAELVAQMHSDVVRTREVVATA
ncbi:MAG: bifunctional riboflavin kinase/FAD synthetase [Thermoleophilia bacterium]|nr:bifunctional riboflavin kinase/FAD synthetase [Thermoleophilia bacterium]